MKKLEDQTTLQLEDLSSCACVVCGTIITWEKDENGFHSKCCDRRYIITSKTYLASVTKNPNIKPDIKKSGS